jgi:phosphatidylserine synthase
MARNYENWSPYAGSSSIVLAVVLLIIAGVLIYLAFRLHHPKEVKRPGTFLGIAIPTGCATRCIFVMRNLHRPVQCSSFLMIRGPKYLA